MASGFNTTTGQCGDPGADPDNGTDDRRTPNVDRLLDPSDLAEQSPAQVAAALCMDQRRRWQDGDRVACEDYVQEWPQIEFSEDLLLDLVYNEYLLQEMHGAAASEKGFLVRFPQFADELTRLFEVHRAIESDSAEPALRSADAAAGLSHLSAARLDRDWHDATSEEALIGGYELIEEIGRGGMGIVYRARQLGVDRVVALKTVLVGRLASPQAVARFQAEAMAAARLDHPGVVPVYEVGRDGNVYFLSMACVEGENLASLLSNGPLAPRRSAELIAQVSRAVDYAHSRGISHRDLKPQNILIDLAGQPRIVDFGLAKVDEQDGNLTVTGQILGTANYLAPEQASGEHHQIGPASDIFSIGAVLYEAITGRPPFEGPTVMAILSRVLDDEPTLPRLVDRSIPRDLETICLKCLAKNPASRYVSAGALGDDLDRFLAGHPILARPVPGRERVWRWCRRHPTVATLLGAVVMLFVLVAVSNVALRRERNRAETHKTQAVAAKESAQWNLAQSQLNEARALRLGGHVGQRVKSLASVSSAVKLMKKLGRLETDRTRLRNEATACLRLCDVELEREWKNADVRSAPSTVAFERGTMRYASVDPDGAILIRDLDTNRQLGRIEGPWSTAEQLCFNRGGTHLAASFRNGSTTRAVLWRLDMADQPPIELGETSAGRSVIDFAPDGKTLAVVANGGAVRLLDIGRNHVTRLLEYDDFHAHGCRFHPTRPLLAIWGDHVVRVVGLDEGDTILAPSSTTADSQSEGGEVGTGNDSSHTDFVHTEKQSILHVAWNSQLDVLATGLNDHNAYLWDLSKTEEPYATLRGHQTWVHHLAFDPSGRYLLTTGTDGTTLVWRSASGRLCLNFQGDRAVFSSDGQHIGSVQHGRVARWRFVDHPECTLIGNPRTYEAYEGDISPCGRWLATGAWDGIRIWNLQSNKPLAKLHNRTTYRVTYAPDGRHLIGHDTDGIVRWTLKEGFPETDPSIIGPERIGPIGFPDARAVSVTKDSYGMLAVSRLGRSALGVRKDDGDYDFREVKTNALAVHPYGELLAIARDPLIEICRELDGDPIVSIPLGRSIDVMCFSPQGRWLLAVTKEECYLYNTETWKESGVFDCGRDFSGLFIRAFDFSEDERWLAIGCQDFRIDVIDVESGQLRIRLPSPTPRPWVCLSPDGRHLACYGEDAKAYLWDLGLVRHRLVQMGLGE